MDYPYPLKIRAVWWDRDNKKVCWINTLKLPFNEETICSDNVDRVAKAITDMEIRGAPAIGVAAALAVASYAYHILGGDTFYNKLYEAIDILWKTRPTAYNLFWALTYMKNTVLDLEKKNIEPDEAVKILEEKALWVLEEDIKANIKMGEYGSELVGDGSTILTHCNAGALATAGYGTALGVIRVAWYKGKNIKVFATETRPMLQGARLTVWELYREGIPVTLVTDNMVGYLMRKKMIDLVIVGADRITREGYVVNKIGTYMIALAAKRNNIPFYVAAPTTTIDIDSTINDIVIEERSETEVKTIMDNKITLEEIPAKNYAFDITDPDLVTGIITEKGIIRPPYSDNIEKIVEKK